jgi:tetratricopeptide (TPR) repeat protein
MSSAAAAAEGPLAMETKDVIMTQAPDPPSHDQHRLPTTKDDLINEWHVLVRTNKLDPRRGTINEHVYRAEAILDKLLPILETDTKDFELFCFYLEKRAKIRERLAAWGSEQWAVKAADDWRYVASVNEEKHGICMYALTVASLFYEEYSLFSESAEMWRKYIKLYTNDIRGYTSLGYALKRIGAFEEELIIRNKIIEMQPKKWKPLIERANIHVSLNRPEEAMSDILSAFELMTPEERESKDALWNRAAGFLRCRHFSAAIGDLDNLLSKFPDHRVALFDRACALNSLGAKDLALRGFRQVLRLSPIHNTQNADAAWNCGVILLSMAADEAKKDKDKSETVVVKETLIHDAIEYFRLSRAYYYDFDPKCDEKIKEKIQSALRQAGIDNMKFDIEVPHRGDRLTPLPKDKTLSAEIEEMWKTLDKINKFSSTGLKQRRKNCARIIEISSRLIRLDPKGRYLYYAMRAQSYKLMCDDDDPDAIDPVADLQFILDNFPDSAFTSPYATENKAGLLVLMAYHFKMTGKVSEAIRYFTMAIAEADNLDRYRSMRRLSVISQSALNPTDTTIDHVSKAEIFKMPHFPLLDYLAREKSLNGRALCFVTNDNLDGVIHDRTRLIEIVPTDAMNYNVRGRHFNFLKKNAKGWADYEKAREIIRNDQKTWQELQDKDKQLAQNEGRRWYPPHEVYEKIRQTAWKTALDYPIVKKFEPRSRSREPKKERASPRTPPRSKRELTPPSRHRSKRERTPPLKREQSRSRSRSRSRRRRASPKSTSPLRRSGRSPKRSPWRGLKKEESKVKREEETRSQNKPRSNWSVAQISKWICELGSAFLSYKDAIEANHVDGAGLLWLINQSHPENELKEIGIRNGIHVNLIIRKLKESFDVKK